METLSKLVPEDKVLLSKKLILSTEVFVCCVCLISLSIYLKLNGLLALLMEHLLILLTHLQEPAIQKCGGTIDISDPK